MARRVNPVQRLQRRYDGLTAPQAFELHERQLADGFTTRVLHPWLDKLSKIGSKAGSAKDKNSLADLLSKAGYPGGLSLSQLQGVRVLIALVLPIVVTLLALAARSILGMQAAFPMIYVVLLALASAGVGFLSMPFILRHMVRKRQHAISRGLPDVLDLLTIAVEAGLGFDAAMDRVGQRYVGPMGEELIRTNAEIRMGRPWNDAMRDMGERTGVEDLRSLVVALLQSRELGINLSNVLHAQSLRLREERARRAREQAQKTPGKIIFPLVGCIFPVLFIVLMGPAMLSAALTLKESGVFGAGGALAPKAAAPAAPAATK